MLPAAVVAGFQFPLLVSLLGRGGRDVGRHTARAYALNTAGAIVGSLAGGFGLMPVFTALLAAYAAYCRGPWPLRRVQIRAFDNFSPPTWSPLAATSPSPNPLPPGDNRR